MNKQELKDFLDEKSDFYNRPEFIQTDPIQIVHGFESKEDIEIAGFLTATISWGNRKSIITSATKMMDCMDRSPFEFVMNHTEEDLRSLDHFVHRTFNAQDLKYFIRSLQHIYLNKGGLERVFASNATKKSLQEAIHRFKQVFFELPHHPRTEKHVSDPLKNSAAKRINMFLRWMVRPNDSGVDFGLWNSLHPSQLSCPLDIHTGNVARKLGLIKRAQNDAKTVKELDHSLRTMDPEDPVKYDFALFGLGVFEGFK
ncbi:MAG: TIGR02757 family protein [Flavobacteriaceae bacterium]|nr:TIGR02757 family protein [Flavobacteriaceae bacterium]